VGRQREPHEEGRFDSFCALHLDPSTVLVHDVAYDGEAESEAVVRALGSEKWLKHVFEIRCTDARAIVRDAD
jgi:hypothetical protein